MLSTQLKFMSSNALLGRLPVDATVAEKTMISEPVFGPGWLDFIDWMFFHLPFTGPAQAVTTREHTVPTIEKKLWDDHFVNMAADHRSDGAREELRAAWKAYITTHFAAQAAGSAAGAKKDFVLGAMLSDDDDAPTSPAAATTVALLPPPPPPNPPPPPSLLKGQGCLSPKS